MDMGQDKGANCKRGCRLKVLVIILAIFLVCGLLIRYVLWPRLHNWSVESLITRFESTPSQTNANTLVALVDNQQVNDKQVERILCLLMTPKVTMRAAYPVDSVPMISVELPFDIRFCKMTASISEDIWAKGEHLHGGSSRGGNHYGTNVRLHSPGREIREPGIYKMELRYSFSVVPSTERTTFKWPSPGVPFPHNLLPSKHTISTSGDHSKPRYKAEFTVPVDIVMAESQYAEQIELTSSPELDKAMRAAFTSRPFSCEYSYTTAMGRRKGYDSIEISYANLPVAAAFEYIYCDEGNSESALKMHIDSDKLLLRTGISGTIQVRISDFLFEEPGNYNGTIILRSDPNSAYRDPAIKSIWDGELRFPINFTVEVEK